MSNIIEIYDKELEKQTMQITEIFLDIANKQNKTLEEIVEIYYSVIKNKMKKEGKRMTKKEREKAVKFIHAYMHPTSNSEFEQKKLLYRDMAIEALEQQTCDDCISREEALIVVYKYFEHYLQLNYDICLDGLRSLPSVIPDKKTGKWIVHPKGIYAHLVCNKCLSSAPYDYPTNYCPNCGAKMEVSE